MATLWNRAGNYIFVLWFLLSIFYLLLFFLTYSQPPQTGCLPYFHTWRGLSANIECRSETCRTRLAGNTGHNKLPKIHHLGNITQLFRAISLQLTHILTIGINLLNSNISPTSVQYGELQPTSGWDRFISLGHLSQFQRVSHLGIITARHSSSRHQPNFAALNRGRHVMAALQIYLAGRPSRWTLAHIPVILVFRWRKDEARPLVRVLVVFVPFTDGWVAVKTSSMWRPPSH